jgi:signal transduction histidine kinase
MRSSAHGPNLGRPFDVLLEEDPSRRAEIYPGWVRRVTRVDVVVAVAFVLASLVEDVVESHDTTGLLVFNATGSLWLGCLAWRRTRPVVPVCVIAAAGLLGSTVTALVWPDAPNSGGVWIVAMLLASYSIGAHGSGRVVVLGVLLPLFVVVAVDWTTTSGWDRVNGIVFITTFVGLLPTLLGGLVRARGDRVRMLERQHELIVRNERTEQESVVMAERLRNAERLQPTILAGLQAMAATADSAGDPGEIEEGARNLLTRTREEVVALSTETPQGPVPEPAPVDHLQVLREAAQPWTVLGAAALAAGMCVESWVLGPLAPGWLVVPAALLVAAPLALSWWRPVLVTALAWLAMAGYCRLVAQLDGGLSQPAFALGTAFVVAALSRRRAAVLGLTVCLLGQLVGVGTDDPIGGGALLVLSWLGGLALQEASRLVEQTHANNELLARQQETSSARAVVEERLRLAREIHDVIGHSLTVVALQAGAARRLTSSDPLRAREVMRTVAGVARSGIAALALDDAAGDIGGLVERVRTAGLTLDADLADVALLDPPQRATVFRVVQEGLTNVLRHAPGSRAGVCVRRGAGGIEVSVVNSAPADTGTGPGTGLGLPGIRDRVTAVGGQVSWRTRDEGGFELRASLPAPTPEPTAALAST